jgi:hypothetical protein
VLIVGAALVVAVMVFAAVQRNDDHQATAATAGNVGGCATLTGDAARACYRRAVGAQLAAAGSVPQAITFAGDDQSAGLLCELHLRAGVTNVSKPAWVSWNEPSVS